MKLNYFWSIKFIAEVIKPYSPLLHFLFMEKTWKSQKLEEIVTYSALTYSLQGKILCDKTPLGAKYCLKRHHFYLLLPFKLLQVARYSYCSTGDLVTSIWQMSTCSQALVKALLYVDLTKG
jgi:hypothetical protein